MNTIRLNDTTPLPPPCVATIGFFDGVHLGHRFLISRVAEEARLAGMQSTVITFDRHPRQVVYTGYMPQLLTTLDMKLLHLSHTGVDNTVVLPFDRHMAAMTARDFMRTVLRDRLNVRRLIIGYDNRFGHNRAEGFDDYVAYGREMGIEVECAEAADVEGTRVSSSVIRRLLGEGKIEEANRCLGYVYSITGRVEEGFREGRRMGFPTANMGQCEQLVPACGVYATRVRTEGTVTMRRAMTNIGLCPTFHRDRLTIETNIFGFADNIYGTQIIVAFEHRIRGEQRFDSEEELETQLAHDREEAMRLLSAED